MIFSTIHSLRRPQWDQISRWTFRERIREGRQEGEEWTRHVWPLQTPDGRCRKALLYTSTHGGLYAVFFHRRTT